MQLLSICWFNQVKALVKLYVTSEIPNRKKNGLCWAVGLHSTCSAIVCWLCLYSFGLWVFLFVLFWLSGLEVFWFICRTWLLLQSIKTKYVMGQLLETSYIKGIFVYATMIHSSTLSCKTFWTSVCLVNSLYSVLLMYIKWQLQEFKLLTCPFQGFSFNDVLTIDNQGEFPQVTCCLWH